jgi:hypothetical protein
MAEASSGFIWEAIVLIILLFAVLLAVKLAATGLVHQLGPIAALFVIAACIAIAYRIEPSTPGKY